MDTTELNDCHPKEIATDDKKGVVKKAKPSKVTPVAARDGSGKSKDPPRKRGPPRPHRKLPQEILDGRITKLEKRITRAKDQLEDAQRHIDGYQKEAMYREQDKKKSE